ncbi:MAG: UDP-N-acetylmuramoyl-L-alanyl-D-glutamate--2,6-diaminopimelate ligase [Bacteroidales bacterium]|nr:UDP-N-acetylmuramoyl-L-alanyl-D-glutamate--2,6-diaminopimelate ligase [Bacteroidales bacterium]
MVSIKGTTQTEVSAIEFDSRKCGKNSLFVAVKGTQTDGHKFIDKAIGLGAAVIICEKLPEALSDNVVWVKVENPARALGMLASNFYGNPSSHLKLIGVTGTNGKTTIVNLLFNLVRHLGYNAGLLSTIENKIGDEVIGSTHTTPDPVQINRLMADMVKSGCDWCFMEVSSHAIDQERIAGLVFTGGIFTNITHDHLDYHKTFDAYLKAKKKFFDELPEEAFALSNIDDKNGQVMLQNTRAEKKYYGLKKPAEFKGKIMENQFEGLQLNINGKDIWCRLVGAFNAYNILAAFGAAVLAGEDEEEVLAALSALDTVEGRFDYVVSSNNVVGIVDYAHTPDALKNVLETIAAIRTRNETLITLIGAGGDRDTEKRAPMGLIAGRMSDRVIITSDNPRSENPESIIEQIKKGIDPRDTGKAIAITDRREAIKTACLMAQPNDIILVAGKGHEKYQEIKGIKHPFDDKQILKEYLALTEVVQKKN